MKVLALKFENYRNLDDAIITPCDGVNVIYGDNAQGKTNLLEALWILSGCRSFRGSKERDYIALNGSRMTSTTILQIYTTWWSGRVKRMRASRLPATRRTAHGSKAS